MKKLTLFFVVTGLATPAIYADSPPVEPGIIPVPEVIECPEGEHDHADCAIVIIEGPEMFEGGPEVDTDGSVVEGGEGGIIDPEFGGVYYEGAPISATAARSARAASTKAASNPLEAKKLKRNWRSAGFFVRNKTKNKDVSAVRKGKKIFLKR